MSDWTEVTALVCAEAMAELRRRGAFETGVLDRSIFIEVMEEHLTRITDYFGAELVPVVRREFGHEMANNIAVYLDRALDRALARLR
jgi:hypothetical protein